MEADVSSSNSSISNGSDSSNSSSSSNITHVGDDKEITYYAQSLLLALLTLCTILGNLFIILTILSHPNLRRPSHLFIASLASTDLLLGLTVMVPRLVDELAGRWIFGFFLCQAYHAMDVTLCTASILHLCCISLDRYFAIVNRPLLYYQRVTTPRVVLSVLVVWALSLMTGFLPVFTGIYSSEEHLRLSRQNTDICDLVVNKYFSVIAGFISFWIPGSVMVWVYVKVMVVGHGGSKNFVLVLIPSFQRQVYRETKRLQRKQLSLSLGEIRRTKPGGGQGKRKKKRRRKRRRNQSSTLNELGGGGGVGEPRRKVSFLLRGGGGGGGGNGGDGGGGGGNGGSGGGGREEIQKVADHHLMENGHHHSRHNQHQHSHQQQLDSFQCLLEATRLEEEKEVVEQGSNGWRKPVMVVTDPEGAVSSRILSPGGVGGDQEEEEEAEADDQQRINRERESRMPLTSLLELYTPPLLYTAILWIGYGNSVVNPFVYGFFSREFRGVILKDYKRFSKRR